jgi:hypothetical protein
VTRPITRRRRAQNAEPSLVKVCAWCGLVRVGDTWVSGPEPAGHSVSHGICPECEARYYRELEEEKPR